MMSEYDLVNLVLILMVIGYLLWNKYRWRIDIDWELEYESGEKKRVGISVWWWDKYHTVGDLVFRVPLRIR
jgi:hypothetical protein